jgi:hypothetical protein
LQRRLLWLTGMGDNVIHDINDAEEIESEYTESENEN